MSALLRDLALGMGARGVRRGGMYVRLLGQEEGVRYATGLYGANGEGHFGFGIVMGSGGWGVWGG